MSRRPPRLLVVLELERDCGLVVVDAESLEDERRLRLWLRRSEAFQTLPEFVARLLDELDRVDEGRAA